MTCNNHCHSDRTHYFISLLQRRSSASAAINGSDEFPSIKGTASFYQTRFGTLVAVNVSGLPASDNICKKHIFAFHIHSGSMCSGNADDAFADAMTHYNPENCDHPYHAGDLPPLFGNDGYAFAVFLSDRFSVNEVVGKAIIIHQNPDDFTTQPAGNSGKKIACGIIKRDRSF